MKIFTDISKRVKANKKEAEEKLRAQNLKAQELLQAQELLADQKVTAKESTNQKQIGEITHVHVVQPNMIRSIIFGVFVVVVIFILVLYMIDKNRVDKNTLIIQSIDKNTTQIFNTLKLLAKNDSLLYRNDSLMAVNWRHFPAYPPMDLNEMSRVSSLFQNRINPITKEKEFHWGIDYRAQKGVKVYASAEGIIEEAGRNDGYGNSVKIKHGNGYFTFYAHLDSIKVFIGQVVLKGDLIGTVGSSGSSTGSHLHYEISYMNKKLDPSIFRSTF